MLPENAEKTSRWDNDAAWHWYIGMMLRELLLEDTGYKLEQEKQGWEGFMNALIAEASGYDGPLDMVNYTESHDEDRLTMFLKDAGLDEAEMTRRAALASAITFTMAGVPMLYHGQEWGECTPMKTLEENPLHWDALEREHCRALHDFYRQLCWFRRNEPALRTENMEVLYQNEQGRCVAFHRWDASRHVVLAANLSSEPQRLTVRFPIQGDWREVFREERLSVKQRKTLTLEPFSFRIYRTTQE
jgi:1,4-alpha-glucan branching enzyme